MKSHALLNLLNELLQGEKNTGTHFVHSKFNPFKPTGISHLHNLLEESISQF